ncbi:anhydro-N-acetylmuramic acid kinase, partial [Clostridioides difficile]
ASSTPFSSAKSAQIVFSPPEKFIAAKLEFAGKLPSKTLKACAKVISNFRVMDIAAGGEGAPLVPYSEFLLYSDNNKNLALQNIG